MLEQALFYTGIRGILQTPRICVVLRQGSPRVLIFVKFASVFSQKYVSMGLQREYLGSAIRENNVDLAVGYQVDIELLFL